MLTMKGYLAFHLDLAYTATLQRIYQHERATARAYQGLASHDLDESHRFLFLKLANIANRRALHYEVRVRLSGAELPAGNDTWPEIFWRWLLMQCGPRCLMKWLDWVQRNDIHRLGSLLMMQEGWQ